MPTRDELLAAANKTVDDVIAPGLTVLFCGINPGLYTAWAGHHFARPGNRFWPALHRSGFTRRLLAPSEEQTLLADGIGITNLVARASATAAELTPDDLQAGGRELEAKLHRYRPRALAVLGIGAYRTAFERKKASLGLQTDRIGQTAIWVLPNPSGLNANYQLAELARMFEELREAVG
ncbi:MAG: G/U mismatch-specific DNA glycosylase [Planctomycetaceae bacterium]